MKTLFRATLTVPIVLFLFSCASGPQEGPEQQPAVTEKEQKVPAPDEEKERAERLRSLVEKYQFAEYAQSEYKEAEEAFAIAEEAYGSDNAAAAESYEAASIAYAKIIKISVDSLYGQWQEKTQKVMNDAAEVKAAKAVPEEYRAAEEKLKKAQEAYEGENYEEASGFYHEGIIQLEQAVATAKEKRERARKSLEKSESSLKETEEKLKNMEQDREDFDQGAEI
jgi:hypothetical protein